jgi:hypothetical protein
MREMILLGAGASIEAGVPGAFNMTNRMLEVFENNPLLEKQSRVLRFVVSGLLFQEGIKGSNPFNGVNIEDLFNAVQVLATRHELEVSPFIGSWHRTVDELDKIEISAQDGEDLKRAFYSTLAYDFLNNFKDNSNRVDGAIEHFVVDRMKGSGSSKGPGQVIYGMIKDAFERLARYHPRPGSSFSSDISSIYNRVSQTGRGRIFQATSRSMIQKLADMVWIEDGDQLDYLHPLVAYANENDLTIATLNYDNTIEVVATKAGFPLETGIEQWSQSGQFPEATKGIYLLKLHGSIDWSFQPGKYSNQKPLPYQVLEKVDYTNKSMSNYQPALIFGQRNKLTTKGPFLDLLRAFTEALDNTDLLTVVGYSFRDEHINEFIGQWLNGNEQRQIRIINGKSFSKRPTPFVRTLKTRLKDRVNIIDNNASDGIRECYL